MTQGCRLRATCVFVRCTHTLLTVGVISTLFWKDTVLKSSLEATTYIWYAVLYVGLACTSLGLYFLAASTNPGFVPIPAKVLYRGESESDDDENTVLTEEEPKFKLRKCGFCGIKQPMRAHHCEDCKRCVRKFDHHCPWLDTCIGERNHKFFWLFSVTKSALIIWTGVIVWQAFKYKPEWKEWFQYNGVLLVDAVIIVIGGFVVISLASFHSYLMITNSTTWEFASRHRITYLKYLQTDYNPFNEGVCRNIFTFCCTMAERKWDLLYKRAIARKGVL